jgi:hypothetical protein
MKCACVILSSVACLALQYFFLHYLINGMIFLKKLLNTKFVFWIFSIKFFRNISHSKKKWARYDKKMYIALHVKYPLFLSDSIEALIFSTDFLKFLTYKISWKSVQWEPSCSMRKDGQTDVMNLIVAFCNFANKLKNWVSHSYIKHWVSVRKNNTLFFGKYLPSILRNTLNSCRHFR